MFASAVRGAVPPVDPQAFDSVSVPPVDPQAPDGFRVLPEIELQRSFSFQREGDCLPAGDRLLPLLRDNKFNVVPEVGDAGRTVFGQLQIPVSVISPSAEMWL